jgi:thiol-disulfide isomerase/thioredoxin
VTRPIAAACFALALLALAGCGNPSGRTPGGDAQMSATAPIDTATMEILPVDGPALARVIAEPGAKATLVNVWASWCQPCREEFPDLVALEREWRDRGFRLVFVSADFSEDVPNAKSFLAEQGVSARTYLKTGDDMQFIDTLDERWSGALPGSFLYDSSGRLVRYWEGKASADSLRARILPVLDAGDRQSLLHRDLVPWWPLDRS